MSEEMVGQRESFFKGYEAGRKEGYLEALENIKTQINSISQNHQAISIPLVNGMIDTLYKQIKKDIK